MRRFEFWKLGLHNVLASALRSGLTILGMSIGVAAILAVFTLGEAGRTQVKNEISRLGIDRIQVTAAERSPQLRSGDAAYLRRVMDTGIDELVMLECEVSMGDKARTAPLIGCQEDYLNRLSVELLSGEKPSASQWLTGGRAALVGEDVANDLALSEGEWFSAAGMMLKCAGILGESQQASRMDTRQVVVVPLALMQNLLGNVVHELSVQVPVGYTPDETACMASDLLKTRALKVDTVSLQVQAEAADSVLMVFVDVLKWVALVCMLAGGIGVTNILLVSVRERRREIGIMQSLGATRMQICGLFLCEALIYALTGGILGLLLGGALIAIAGNSIGLSPVVQAGDCTGVFLSALLLGLFSGVAPAAAACLMKPVDALRDD